MATWNTPTTVATGSNLTSALWNDQLGANGSLQWLYDQTRATIAVSKSTNTALTAGTSYTFVWDILDAAAANMRQNITLPSFPTTQIVLPTEGAYIVTLYLRYNAAATISTNFVTPSYTYTFDMPVRANTSSSATALIYATAANTALTVSVIASASGTVTYTSNNPTQSLFVAKAGW
jgi:hypothetical protein